MNQLTVLIPAHNEEDVLRETVQALYTQTRVPDRVIVVADNCTDATVNIGRNLGIDVYETVGNIDKKAGALNQALKFVDSPYVMVLDADTVVADTFIEEGLKLLKDKVWVGAVGGVFEAVDGKGPLWQAQANEFTRYGVQIDVTNKTSVLTGTAAIIRMKALKDVASRRGWAIPGNTGDIYDSSAITEDSELTLALKSIGWRVESPLSMTCKTETMPTLKDLHKQRVRWYSGMLENLKAYGWTQVTKRYFGQQVMLCLGTLMLWALLALTTVSVVTGGFALSWPWFVIGGIFVVERMVTVWPGGKKARWFSALILPELIYDVILQVAFVNGLILAIRGRQTSWNHVTN